MDTRKLPIGIYSALNASSYNFTNLPVSPSPMQRQIKNVQVLEHQSIPALTHNKSTALPPSSYINEESKLKGSRIEYLKIEINWSQAVIKMLKYW